MGVDTLDKRVFQNVFVVGPHIRPDDDKLLGMDDGPIWMTTAKTIEHLMKELDIYPSTSEAKRAGREGPIPSGFTELKASKKRMLWIWNPSE